MWQDFLERNDPAVGSTSTPQQPEACERHFGFTHVTISPRLMKHIIISPSLPTTSSVCACVQGTPPVFDFQNLMIINNFISVLFHSQPRVTPGAISH
jgi:hypothetical protein